MSHGGERPGAPSIAFGLMSDPPQRGPLRTAAVALGHINRLVVALSMVAVIAACLVLTAGVVMRYLFSTPTDWQDEISMFLLVGSIFSCGAAVQAQRGHIGIEAVAGLLPSGFNRLRLWLCDVTSLLFCSFFSWKSWTLLYEAWSEGMTTSSTWAPPLWIPYGLMSVGMALLSLQLLIQVLAGPVRMRGGDA